MRIDRRDALQEGGYRSVYNNQADKSPYGVCKASQIIEGPVAQRLEQRTHNLGQPIFAGFASLWICLHFQQIGTVAI